MRDSSSRGKKRTRTWRRGRVGTREDAWDPKKTRRFEGRDDGREEEAGWERFPLTNAAFEEYYQHQGVVPNEEWESFLECLRKRLPSTFRINGSGKYASFLKKKLQEKLVAGLHQEGVIEMDGKRLQPPRPIAWYPNDLAWHIDCSRNQIRKVPVLAQIHDFLKRENDIGSISRQEEVSMIPPLMLDVKPHHWVLDMCAAPGSKTLQLLELVQATEGQATTGLVVANDSDIKRCNLLIHQTKRMNSPCLVVTNHEAQSYPMVKRTTGQGQELLQYDRILCDVPCSGDGTMRKAPDLWRRWTPGSANGLHPLQVKIAKRAAHLLKVGGRLVYSTCSLNPVENEAVVAALLKHCEGCLRVVDMSPSFAPLKRRPGMVSWKVRGKKAGSKWFDSWDQVDARDPEAGGLVESMFPPSAGEGQALQHCIRVLPHHGDTGGFFVTVLEKTAELPQPSVQPAQSTKKRPMDKTVGAPVPAHPAEQVSPNPPWVSEEARSPPVEPGGLERDRALPIDAGLEDAPCGLPEGLPGVGPAAVLGEQDALGNNRNGGTSTTQAKGPSAIKPKKRGGVDPIVPVTDPDLLRSIRDFYGLGDLPYPLHQCLISRTPGAPVPKKLYYLSSSAKSLLDSDTRGSLRIFSVGIKAFERQSMKDGSVPCKFRLAQDSVRFLAPYISKQRLDVSLSDFRALLRHRCLLTSSNETSSAPLLSDPVAMDDLQSGRCGMGTCLISIRKEASLEPIVESGLSLDEFTVTAWRGAKSLNLLVGEVESSKLLDAIADQFGPAEPGENNTQGHEITNMANVVDNVQE
eukprot:jgi/Pico_ML_1/51597/g2595.t1